LTDSPFSSFFIGGFECSTHRNPAGKRLDMISATHHDRFARADYRRLTTRDIRTARDGVRWHLIERNPGEYDFSTALPSVRAAREANVQVIWDLFHYGYPDDIDIFSTAFITRFARFARRFAEFLRGETDTTPYVTPANEISFYAWIGGDMGWFAPYQQRRGVELKAQLVRACIEAIEEMWAVNPRTRIVYAEPLINVIPPPDHPEQADDAEHAHLLQYQAYDMLSGRIWTHLGGDPKYLDILGINYYNNNQWMLGRQIVTPADPHYRPLGDMLLEIHRRYERPMFIAETGCENEARPAWLRYICEQTRHAHAAGADIHGICLYPILNHPGWDDDRHCHNGLWDYPEANGDRPIYEPLAAELSRQQRTITPLPHSSLA